MNKKQFDAREMLAFAWHVKNKPDFDTADLAKWAEERKERFNQLFAAAKAAKKDQK